MFNIIPISLSELTRFESGKSKSALSRGLKGQTGVLELHNRITGVTPEALTNFWKEQHPELFKPSSVIGANLCGGSHKSSIVLGLAAASYRICGGTNGIPHVIIDGDSQASTTINLLGESIRQEGQNVLVDYLEGRCEIQDLIREIPSTPNFWVVPSSLDNIYLDRALQKPSDLKSKMHQFFKALEAHFKKKISLFIDTPPALSGVFSSAILAIVQSADVDKCLVIPVRPDLTSIRGSKFIIDEVTSILSTFSFNLDSLRIEIVLSGLDRRQPILASSAMKSLTSTAELQSKVSPIVLRFSSEVAKAWNNGTSIFDKNAVKSGLSSDVMDLWLYLKNFNGKAGNA